MHSDSIQIGDLLTDIETRKSYRVILIREDVIEVCRLDITSLELFFISLDKIREKIINQEIIVEKEVMKVVDINLMPNKEVDKFNVNKEIINKINEEYGPTYEKLMGKQRKVHISKLSETYNKPKETIRRLYIRYIQSGCSDYALLDNRYTSNREQKRKEYDYTKKPGKKPKDICSSNIVVDTEVKKQFDDAIQYFKSGRVKTYDASYHWLRTKYYTQTRVSNGEVVIEFLPDTDIPSLKQFYYYVENTLNVEEIDQIKTSKREQRNDKRLLTSDAGYNVLGPGDLVEIDAVEVDVSLVSEVDRTKSVGRPVVYVMIDIYTRTIIAIAISYDNNSEIALTNCFLNLGDDKVEFCKKFGLIIDENMWMSNIIPKRIRCDRGADFRSKAFQRICKELGIDRQLVSAATGSLKGTVEQVFKQIHAAQNVHLENKGLIEKRYDSKHHEEATLTITAYTKMLLAYVLAHNAKAIDNYPLTREMIEQGIENKPLPLWKYGCKKYGEPQPIRNKNQFIYSLLTPTKAALDRRGLRVGDLYYMNWNDEQLRRDMYKQQNKVTKMDVRCDPRDVGQIFYLRNGQIEIAKLNQMITGNADFAGMTSWELAKYNNKKREIKAKTKKDKQLVKDSLFLINQSIVEQVGRNQSTYASAKNLREDRSSEKQMVSQKNNVMEHMEKVEIQDQEAPKIENKVEKKVAEKTKVDSFEDALDAFEE